MKNGDAFAKKFGGTNGNDSDWFKLTINAYQNGNLKTEKVEFYLADFRFADNSKDYMVKDWTFVNLTSLGGLDSLKFTLTSSDTNQFGLKTPAFFCAYITICVLSTKFTWITLLLNLNIIPCSVFAQHFT
jgi:hypothetical protein